MKILVNILATCGGFAVGFAVFYFLGPWVSMALTAILIVVLVRMRRGRGG